MKPLQPISLLALILLLLLLPPFASAKPDGQQDKEHNCSRRGTDLGAMSNIYAGFPKLKTNSSAGYCGWKGVQCSGCSVEKLNLSSLNLSGTIPQDISNLASLTALDLSNNSFSGFIPAQLFNLPSLFWLSLSRNHFNGSLPEVDVGWLTNLSSLDVSYNNLSGNIPSSLARLLRLQFLDLSYNDFEGSVPTGGIFNQPGNVSLVGNTKICGKASLSVPACNRASPPRISPPPGGAPPPRVFPPPGGAPPPGSNATHDIKNIPEAGKGRSGLRKAVLAVIVVVVAIALFMFLLLFGLLYKRKYSSNENLTGRVKDINAFFRGRPAPGLLTYADLETTTQGFSSSNLIGSGTIGSVYRGFLQQGKKKHVAVKVLHKEALTGDPKKLMESSLQLQGIKHKNLAKMIASCADVDSLHNQFAAWVYDLIPNGNLEMWLHEEVVFQAMSFRKWNLSCFQRLNMAIDIASALVHLHCKLEMPMVLCNLKPSNILVAEDLTACVADFGMVRHFPLNVVIKNSNGYVAPECENGNTISPMCDVYSFGVILLEMFTGKRPTNEAFTDGLSLRKYVLERFHLGLEDILDPLLISEETDGKLAERARECLSSVIRLALLCSSESAEDRMEMAEALKELEGIKGRFLEVGGNGVMSNRRLNHIDSTAAMLNA